MTKLGPEISAHSGRLSDRHAAIQTALHDNGGAVVVLNVEGNRGGTRTERVRVDDAGRRRLIRQLGGTPLDVAPNAAGAVVPVDLDAAALAPAVDVPETHELFAWDHRNRAWIAVEQGDEDTMNEREEARWKSARKNKLIGSAFWVAEVGDIPGLSPHDLGIDPVTGETDG